MAVNERFNIESNNEHRGVCKMANEQKVDVKMMIGVHNEELRDKSETSKVVRPDRLENVCPVSFGANGYSYKLVRCSDGLALFSQHKKNAGGTPWGYEVHVLRWVDETKAIIKGKEVIFAAGIKLAGNEEFGEWAWAFRALEDVYERFPQLKKQ